jgi:hypothetical protein
MTDRHTEMIAEGDELKEVRADTRVPVSDCDHARRRLLHLAQLGQQESLSVQLRQPGRLHGGLQEPHGRQSTRTSRHKRSRYAVT